MGPIIDFFYHYSAWIALGGLLGTVAVAVFVGILAVRVGRINQESQLFFSGKNGKDLEAVIRRNGESLKALDQDIQELYDISNKINSLSQKSIHRTALVRFNPFKDIGGDQSFSLALLDGKNSGFTISSLHTREGTRVYVKPVLKGKAEKYALTEEEIQAVKMASLGKSENKTDIV